MPVRAVLLFAAWTLFVWGTRISNIVEDDGSGWALSVAVLMTTGGAAVALAAIVRRGQRPAVFTVAALTLLVWIIRLPGLLLDADHSAGFKLVHTALAVVSIGLALTATAAVRARRPVRA